jgi:hypothetical protein
MFQEKSGNPACDIIRYLWIADFFPGRSVPEPARLTPVCERQPGHVK